MAPKTQITVSPPTPSSARSNDKADEKGANNDSEKLMVSYFFFLLVHSLSFYKVNLIKSQKITC